MGIKYTKKILEEVVNRSSSLGDVIKNLGLKLAGGNYYHIGNRIKFYNIDTSHFKKTNKGRTPPNKHTKESFLLLLKKDKSIKGSTILKYLKRFQIKDHLCEECNRSTWNGKEIPLEVDHIDGDHYNNELANLRLLCPNCHALTETYCGKNIATSNKIEKSPNKKVRLTKIEWPSKEEILERLKKSNYSKLSRELGVSDNAIRKFLKRNE